MALASELERLSQTMTELGALTPGLDSAARQRFADPILDQQGELQRLASRVSTDGALLECWTAFREAQQRCVTLTREYLAFTLGRFVRHAQLDGGLLLIADALLTELGERVKVSWKPLAVLAETEWYGEEAQIIRLRFAEASIWNVPVAAHEFGHFAGPRLAVRTGKGRQWELTYPVQDALRREAARGPAHWSRMHEFFADAFAVYLTGPAYACACLLLRFDPTVPDSDGPTHPGHAKRAHLMARMLEKMDEAAASTSYRGVLRQLRQRWRESVAQAAALDDQHVAEIEASAAAAVDAVADEIWQLLKDTLSAQRYAGMASAQALKPALGVSVAARTAGAMTVADVLNAAWLCRLDHWDDDRDTAVTIAAQAYELCQTIAGVKVGP